MPFKRLWAWLSATETEQVMRTSGPIEGRVIEPVRDVHGRIDVDASVRRLRRSMWQLWFIPGGRRMRRFLTEGAREDLAKVAQDEDRR